MGRNNVQVMVDRNGNKLLLLNPRSDDDAGTS